MAVQGAVEVSHVNPFPQVWSPQASCALALAGQASPAASAVAAMKVKRTTASGERWRRGEACIAGVSPWIDEASIRCATPRFQQFQRVVAAGGAPAPQETAIGATVGPEIGRDPRQLDAGADARAQAAARSSNSARSRLLRVSEAARSSSTRASSSRPSFTSRSPRTLGKRW